MKPFYVLQIHEPSTAAGAQGRYFYLAGDGSKWESDPAHCIRFRWKLSARLYQRFRVNKSLRGELQIVLVHLHRPGWRGERDY